jgi:hypothetical protein
LCLTSAPAARAWHSFLKDCVFEVCIQYPHTGLNSSVQANDEAPINKIRTAKSGLTNMDRAILHSTNAYFKKLIKNS